MADFRAELAALVAAYDEHGGRWPQEDEEALCQAVEHARAVLDRGDAAGSPAGAAATAAVAAAIAAGQPVTLPSGAVIADPAWFESRIAIRAVLAQSEPAPVADGEVAELVALLRHEAAEDEECDHTHWLTPFDMRRAADLLERQAAAAPVARLPEDAQVIEPANRIILAPVPAPIPVSERLPEPDDCDAEGNCWWFSFEELAWIFADLEYAKNRRHTYWLPAHALPLPEFDHE